MLPRANGTIEVTALDTEKADSMDAAVKAAHKYCKDKNQQAVFISDVNTTYVGTMDEASRNLIRDVSKGASGLAMATGTGVGVNNNETSANFRQIGTAGKNTTSGKDYKSITSFKCQKE